MLRAPRNATYAGSLWSLLLLNVGLQNGIYRDIAVAFPNGALMRWTGGKVRSLGRFLPTSSWPQTEVDKQKQSVATLEFPCISSWRSQDPRHDSRPVPY